eukprot:scaffold111936_cov95-Phaeocystis_antarctica.AAC.1
MTRPASTSPTRVRGRRNPTRTTLPPAAPPSPDRAPLNASAPGRVVLALHLRLSLSLTLSLSLGGRPRLPRAAHPQRAAALAAAPRAAASGEEGGAAAGRCFGTRQVNASGDS